MAITPTLADHAGKMPSAPLINLVVAAALDNSYPAGGYAFDPGALFQSLGNYDKAPAVQNVLVEGKDGYIGVFDRANSKLLIKTAVSKNLALSPAGLAIGVGSKAKVLIANTVVFLTDGVFASKTTAEVAFTATTHDIANDALLVQEACYLLSLDSSGTPTITKGATSSGAGTASVPNPPAGDTVIGYVRIAVGAGATPFDASTDLLDAAHITDTYVDLAYVPGAQATTEVPTGTDLSVTPGSLRTTLIAR